MKILFAHDHKFFMTPEGLFFSPGNFHFTILKRYLDVFGELVVVARAQPFKSELNVRQASGAGISFVVIPNISTIAGRLLHYSEAKSIIQEQVEKTDGVIARLPSEIGNLAIRTAIRAHKPWAVEVVGCAWDSYWTHGALSGKFYAPFAYLSMRNIVKKSKFTLYVTESFLQSRYPSKGLQTNCSNVEITNISESILEDRLNNLIQKNKPLIIGFIGTLNTKTKGLETALKALKILNKKNKNFRLEIVGGGKRDLWINLAKKLDILDQINFLGLLQPGAEINSWLDHCHVYIQPSYTEGLPRAVIEAMSRGCPVVGSNVGGIPELIDHKFLFPPKDYKELANKISILFSDKNLLIEQAQKNFQNSKKYNKQILDKRRKEFWQNFAQYIKKYSI